MINDGKSVVHKLKNLISNGLSYILMGNFLSKFVALLSSVIIVRLVDKTEYAYLSYADNLYSYINLFTGLGLGHALLVVCTPDVSRGKQRSYLNYALLYGGLFEFLAALLLCVVTQIIDIPFEQSRSYILFLMLYPVLTSLFNTLQAFVRVKRNNRLYAVLGAIHTISFCIISLILVFLMKTIGVVLSRYLAVILVIILVVKYISSVNKGVLCEKLSKTEKHIFFSTAIAMMTANLFSSMIPINEAFIINNLIQDEIVTANFKVAGIIPSLLPIITSSIMVYYFPIIAAMKNSAQIKRKVFKIAAINMIVIVSVTAIGMLLTPFGIRLVYGQKYSDAAGLSYLLWIMRAMHTVLVMVPLNVLPAIGKSKFNALISAGTCIIHVVLDYFFISMWKIDGVAYAAMITYVLTGLTLWLYFIRVCSVKKE